jgi:hypothetical protein
VDQSDKKLITIRCGRCRNTFQVQSDETTAVCACGTTNRISPVVNKPLSIICGNCKRMFDVNRDAKSATCTCGTVLLIGQVNKPLSIMCGNCQRKFDVNRDAESATCTCGTVLHIGQVTANVNESLSRNVPTRRGIKTDGSSSHLGKLETVFPRRAEELRNHVRNGGKLSGLIENVASNIWSLSQLWLVFLDGDDFGFTKDREIYDSIVTLAHTRPRCSIEYEASIRMHMIALSMSNFEIATALSCSVDSVGQILLLNGSYDETYQMLVRGRGRVDPTLRQ